MWSESVHGYQLPDLQRVEPSRNVQLPYAIFAFYPTRVWQKYLCMHANMSIWFNWNVMHMYTQEWICICSLHIHFSGKNNWDYEPCLPHKCTAWFLGCAKTRNQCTNVIIYKAAWIGIDRHIRKDPMDPHMNTDRYITVCIQIIIFWRWRSR